MNRRIEGTIALDGLVEGRLPALPGAELKLREWINFARQAGLLFHLEVDGGRFSILADNAVRSATTIGPDPAEVTASALRELLKAFPPAERGQINSTLRSVEYRRGQEIQTLYTIRPDGAVDPQQRTLTAHTTAPLSRRERFLARLATALALVAVIGLSTFFVDYRSMWQRLRDETTSLSADAITVDASTFDPYFTVEARRISDDGAAIILTLRRRQPLAADDLSAIAATQPSADLRARLALEAVARGYVRAEIFAADGRFLGAPQVRIARLRDAETADIPIPLPRNPRAVRVSLTY